MRNKRSLLPALGSETVVPTTVSPESSAALATALAKSASVKKEPSLELRALDRALLVLLLSVTLAQDAIIEPEKMENIEMHHGISEETTFDLSMVNECFIFNNLPVYTMFI